MKSLLMALMRAIARVAASEAGELLSVRRKSHLLQAEMYQRLGAQSAPTARRAAPMASAASRHSCARSGAPLMPAKPLRQHG